MYFFILHHIREEEHTHHSYNQIIKSSSSYISKTPH